MTVDIDTLFVMLDEEQPTEVQEAALREARKIKSLSVFMQPIEYKWSWENCAKVICEKTDKSSCRGENVVACHGVLSAVSVEWSYEKWFHVLFL